MSIISDLADAVKQAIPGMREAGHTVVGLRARIVEIDAEIAAVDRLPLHPDDVVALYTKASDETRFVEHLRRHYFTPETLTSMATQTLEAHRGAHLTATPTDAPFHPTLISAPFESLPQANAWALEAVLGSIYRDRVAALIKQALPPGYSGVTLAERKKRVAKLQKEREAAVEGVDKLTQQFAALGFAINDPKSGSDIDVQTARERAEGIIAGRINSITGMSIKAAVDELEQAITDQDIADAKTAGEIA